jgi:PAS domain S-box-containing protein
LLDIGAHCPDALFATDPHGAIIYISQAAQRLLGCAPDALVGQPLVSLLAGADRPNLLLAIQSALANGPAIQEVPLTIRRADGHTLLAELSVTPLVADGTPAGATGLLREISGRRSGEAARLSLALEASNAGIWEWDLETNENYWSEELWKVYGLEPHSCDPSYEAWLSLVHPDDRTIAAQTVQAAAIEGKDLMVEFRIRRTGGSVRWIFSQGRLLRVTPGKPGRFIGIAVDITERKRAEDARRQSEGRLAFALESTGTGAWDLNLRDHTAECSLLHDRIFGHDSLTSEWSFEVFLSYVLPEDRAEVIHNFQTVVETGADWDFECRIRRRDGEIRWIWAAGHPRRDSSGQVAHMTGVVQDITERKRTGEALIESEDHRRAILQNAMDGFWVTDSEGRILEVNQTYCRLSGYTAEELLGMHAWDLEANETKPEQVARFQRLLHQHEDRFESRHRRKDGTLIDLEISLQYLPSGGGRVAAFLRDITERKRSEQERAKLQAQFLQAQKMESVGRLAGGIAHDFNNLLTVINGYSQMLLDSLTPVDPLRGSLSEIHKAGERAASLTQQLLAFSRKQILSPRELDVNRVVRDLLPMLKRLVGEDIEVLIALRAENGTIHADAHQIEQVIMNLVVNARDAITEVGKLIIETADVVLDERYQKNHPEVRLGRYAQLTVSDTGSGMDAETRSRIFEPFFTTKEAGKGTGLGLSIVQGIVAQSGGYIDVYSEQGIGTTFKIYLPALAGAAGEEKSQAAAAVTGGKESVLVVEDQGEVRKYAVDVLKAYGYRVLQAASAVEALTISEHENIDLVLTDVVMPNMSGRDLVDRLKAREPGLKVLYMSGYTDNVITHRGLLEAGTAFIQKPFSPQALARQVRTALGSAARSARILVAEDEAGVRRFLRDVLQGRGFLVTEAVSASQILQNLRSGQVDLVVTSLSLAEQGELGSLQALRKQAPQAGLIALSSGFAGETSHPARTEGADAVLHKPVRVDQLLAKVTQVLRLRR